MDDADCRRQIFAMTLRILNEKENEKYAIFSSSVVVEVCVLVLVVVDYNAMEAGTIKNCFVEHN